MPLGDPYGVWKATIMFWHTVAARDSRNSKSPHGYLIFWDDDTPAQDRIWNAQASAKWDWYRENWRTRTIPFRSSAINVKSGDRDESRIVYWTGELTNQALISQLQGLSGQGFHELGTGSGLDFLRDGIINTKDGITRPWNVPGDNDDIIDAWDQFFVGAISFENSELYIFGEQYMPGGDGIHQIHMNQGNFERVNKSWYKENGVGQDGGVIVKQPDGKWKYFFTAFASQASATDDRTGHPKSDNTPLMRDVATTAGPGPVPTKPDGKPVDPSPHFGIEIKAALVNPDGPDNDPRLKNFEKVELVNFDEDAIDLTGWKIVNRAEVTKDLPPVELAGNGGSGIYDAGPECYLGNNGGLIAIRDANGATVDSVVYNKRQAKQEGEWIQLL